jgi:hypothetical protein
MTQVDLGPAGIAANIEHYEHLVIQKQNELKQAQDELVFWTATLKETHAQEVYLRHTQG